MSFDRERYMAVTFGHSASEWEAAREWLTMRLRRVAREQTTITYSELCEEMARAGVLHLEPHSSELARLLAQINLLEHESRRPLISALVVHKGGDWQPGPGFWSFARGVGIDPGTGETARHLAQASSRRHPGRVEEEQGIYRGEVITMMGVLADINVHVNEILAYIEGGDDDEWEEEEEEEDPS